MEEFKKRRISRKMTVGFWCERTIWELRHPTRLLPSANWMVYATLLHKLREEGSVIDVPVAKVGDRECRQLLRWLLRRSKGKGAAGVMKTFTALMGRARRARLTRYAADFPYRDFIPRCRMSAAAADVLARGGSVRSLSEEKWSRFLALDLSQVKAGTGPKADYWKEVYRDYCILLYELKSRPVDVLQLHASNLAPCPVTGRTLCSYVPAKKRNQGTVVVQYVSSGAAAIIDRYRGCSPGGYVMPFPMNARRWNLDNAAQFEAHYKASRNVLAPSIAFSPP